jgi:hypothetical protein
MRPSVGIWAVVRHITKPLLHAEKTFVVRLRGLPRRLLPRSARCTGDRGPMGGPATFTGTSAPDAVYRTATGGGARAARDGGRGEHAVEWSPYRRAVSAFATGLGDQHVDTAQQIRFLGRTAYALGGASVREGRLGQLPDGVPVSMGLQRGPQPAEQPPYDLVGGCLLVGLGVDQCAFEPGPGGTP